MSKRMPPVPPAGRSDKGPGNTTQAPEADQAANNRAVPENLAEQDRQGAVKQNTTNTGYQQDR